MHRCCKSLNEVNNLAEQKNTQPPITNPALVEAMNEMKKERSQKSEVAFVNTLKTARFFVPANISKVQQAAANDDGTVELKEQPQIRFLLFNNQEGKKYFPLFTDIDEYRKWDKHTEAQMAAITFRDLCQILQKNPNPDAAGAVVNPFGQNIMIPTETLFRVNNTEALAPGTKIQLGSLKEEPTELLDAMRAYLSGKPEVRKVFLRVMKREDKERPNFLLVVDADVPNDGVATKALYDGLAESAKPHLRGMELAIVPANNKLGEAAVQDAEPFYEA